jgi:hypothetical protein
MKDSACERWMALADRAALGDPLTADEARFEREHQVRCEECAAESRFWESLGGSLADDSEPLRTLDVDPVRGSGHRRFGWKGWSLAAGSMVAIAAAAAAVVVGFSSRNSTQELQGSAGPDARVSLVLVSGQVDVRGAQAAAGAALRPTDVVRVGQGRACLAYSSGTSACVGRGSELRVVAADSEQRRLSLRAGAVVCQLDKQPTGVRFSVETERGRVTAKGTVFAVEHLPNSEFALRVHRGVVEVELPHGQRSEFRAPASVVLGREIRRGSPGGEAWQRDSHMIEVSSLWAEGAVAPVDIQARPEGSRVTLDGIEVGESPVSTLVGRGDHDIVVSAPGFSPTRDRFVVVGAERVNRSPVLTPQPVEVSEVAQPSAPPVSAVPSPVDLLARARTLRSAGRYREAAAAYQNLVRIYPRSGEARAGLVSLGELQLSQLGNPKAALRSFESYLRGGGSLTQEARYGRIRALSRLGRAATARQSIEAFLRDYPGSVQAKSLRDRLSER